MTSPVFSNSCEYSNLAPLTLDGACERSKNIVVAEYNGHESRYGIEPSSLIWAKFHCLRRIKTERSFPTNFVIQFDFSNVANSNKPPDWKFNEEVMPKKGYTQSNLDRILSKVNVNEMEIDFRKHTR